MNKKKTAYCIFLMVLIYFVQFSVSFENEGLELKIENEEECDNDCEEIVEDFEEVPLNRKKRALVFPAGSSLQLAYDQTIPIVAAQMLFTIGVTVALAFELPDKPLHYITKQLRENLQVHLHGPKTTAAPATNATNEHSRIDLNSNNLKYIYNNRQEYYNLMNKHSYYYGNNGFKDRIDDQFAANKSENAKDENEIISKKVVKTYVNKDGKKVITMKVKYGHKKKKLGNVFLRKHNRVYPVFGKRSVDDHLTHEDIFYADHHRNSRFEVYEKIKKFLNERGKDGAGCVLRALCETAQKNQSDEKAPFLIEILRAIFTIPHQVLPYRDDSHQVYDDAHSKLDVQCKELYPQCKDSIWSPDFRF